MRNVLITGGTRGIGLAVAKKFASAGDRVVIIHRQSTSNVALLQERRNLEDQGAIYYKADLSSSDQRSDLIDHLRRDYESIDVIIHAAAMAVLRDTASLGGKHLRHSFEITVVALLEIVNGLLGLFKGGGSIIALSSLGAQRAQPYYAAVGVAKAGMESLIRHYAQDLGKLNIRANVVCAGLVETAGVARLPNIEQLVGETKSRTPSGRVTNSEDVAALVYGMCQPDLRQVTGSRFVIDGGFEAMS